MEEKVKIEMTAGQAAAFKAFQEAEERKAAQEKARQMRADYVTMVDNEIESAIPVLRELSEDIKTVKQKVYDNFRTILDLKAEMFRLSKGKDIDVKSNTFTNSRGDMRITLGAYMLDNYLDTAEDGVAIVKEYISSLAKDDESQALVNMVLKLLAKDAKGTLKAQRIIQLRKIADESGNERFIEGVKIIEDAYKPIPSKTFVQAQVKNSMGAWENIPLGMTES
ncbi:MAG: DUF3164 family protein [Candidatus Cryptobacteroides sp.]